MTLAPNELGPEDLAATRKAGVSDRALLDATYICVGFNIIARIADALGFRIPTEDLFFRAARLLRIFGYRRLSGFWIHPQFAFSKNGHHDPYARKLERLRYTVLSGPGSLPSDIRHAISQGANLSGALGIFTQKVSEHAFTLSDDDIAELHRAKYTDDQIFEAIVSAALGAGLFRLERVLSLIAKP